MWEPSIFLLSGFSISFFPFGLHFYTWHLNTWTQAPAHLPKPALPYLLPPRSGTAVSQNQGWGGHSEASLFFGCLSKSCLKQDMLLSWKKELHTMTLESSYLLCPSNIIAQHRDFVRSGVLSPVPGQRHATERAALRWNSFQWDITMLKCYLCITRKLL